jgi:hypothetical protein
MGYLGKEELQKMDFAYLDNDVKISDKTSLDQAYLISIGHRSSIDDLYAVSGLSSFL